MTPSAFDFFISHQSSGFDKARNLMISSFFTGWFLGRWYELVSLSPPKIHPAHAMLYGMVRGAIDQPLHNGVCFLSKRIFNRDPEKAPSVLKIMLIAAELFTATLIVGTLTNQLNLNYLKLDRINEKMITLRPVSIKDFVLMESTAWTVSHFVSRFI